MSKTLSDLPMDLHHLILSHDEDAEEVKNEYLTLPISVNGEFCIGKEYPVEVKSAGDKGMGVFATKNIKRGTICCYYDGICPGPACALLITGEHGFAQNLIGEDDRERILAGFRSQLRRGGCAQMCNDASTTYTDNKDLTYLKNINVRECLNPCGKLHCYVKHKWCILHLARKT